jgi:hypothetical protein
LSERLWRISVGFLTIVAGLSAAPALAQDFSAGKTAAQLFASDCSACHKSPAGLAKGQSVSSLTSFLREHYTTKAESAAALAAYLTTAGPGTARISPQAPITGPKARNAEGNEEKPAPKPRPAAAATTAATGEPDKQPEAEASAPAAPREAAKPSPVDPVVAKLNFYAAARGEPKDTARLATPAKKLESDANSGTGTEAAGPSADPNAKRKPPDKKRDTTASTGDAAAPHPPRPRRAQAPVQAPADTHQ